LIVSGQLKEMAQDGFVAFERRLLLPNTMMKLTTLHMAADEIQLALS
jgi:hypothetical protein